MAEPSSKAESVPVLVIGSEFISPNGIEIIVDTKSKLSPKGGLLFTDVNHNVMAKVKSCDSNFHDQRLLIDPYDKPIVLLRQKMHKKPPSKNAKLDKHKFMVTIYPNVDYAFVVALIAIIHAMKKSSSEVSADVATGVIEGVIGAVVGGS